MIYTVYVFFPQMKSVIDNLVMNFTTQEECKSLCVLVHQVIYSVCTDLINLVRDYVIVTN